MRWDVDVEDPLAGTAWSQPGTVSGFAQSPPNPVLVEFASAELARATNRRALDVGCGAGRNSLPLARLGWHTVGTDLSWPMVAAAFDRARAERLLDSFQPVLAPMHALPIRDRSVDLLVAHGIWNLARSAAEFRAAVAEGARVARPGAALFVFTFSRNTLPASAAPVEGEPFAFTQFSGEPQCFLTESQLVDELAQAGFLFDPALPIRELNLPRPGQLQAGKVPVIFEAAFRRRG
jgi:SAM-dependent methyltransferase